MKKKLLACVVPLLVVTTQISYAAPIELFSQDYETITEAIINRSYGFIVQDIDTVVEAEATSENIANFQAVTSTLLQDGETEFTTTENGEVVFTNYAEGKGVATILSKGTLAISKDTETAFELKDITQQIQIDRENLQYKFTQQYPEISFNSPTENALFHIAGGEGKGVFTFTDNFKVVDNFNSHYQIGQITLENSAKGLRSLTVNDTAITAVVNPADLYQKFEIIINGIALEMMPEVVTESGFSHLNIAQLLYSSGVNRDNRDTKAAEIFNLFAIKALELQSAQSDTEMLFGDFKLKFDIAPVTDEILSQELLALSNEYLLNTEEMNPYAYLQKIFVEGSTLTISLDGDLGSSGSQNSLSITPNDLLIEQLAAVDLVNDPEAVDNIFSGLSFFEFVDQYIDAIDLRLSVDKNYVIELGSNILVSSGQQQSKERARREMKEYYQQFQLMATLINAEMPLVEFVRGKARIHIEYRNEAWFVNDQQVDLEAIVSLFSE